METVRKPMTQETVVGPHPLCPSIGETHSIATIQLKLCPPSVCSADLEPGGENQTVYFIFYPLDHNAMLGHPINSFAFRVYQFDSGSVEGREIVIIEGGSFTPLPVPWLERLSGLRVGDGRGYTIANLVHLLEISDLCQQCPFFFGEICVISSRKQSGQLLEETRPSVIHEIFFDGS